MTVMTARLMPLTLALRTSAALVFDHAARVRAAAGGDRAAFDELYMRYASMVHGILLARVPVFVAEDLVQDVFLTAFRKLSGLRAPEAFPGWLVAIARNRAVEYHRSARHEADVHAEAARRQVQAPASISLDVLSSIRKLPEAYRETLILRLVEGMTGPEIAERTGLTPDSVRVNLFRGMKMLREELGRRTK